MNPEALLVCQIAIIQQFFDAANDVIRFGYDDIVFETAQNGYLFTCTFESAVNKICIGRKY